MSNSFQMLDKSESGWTHKRVYDALVAKGYRKGKSTIAPYVVLYPQEKNAALLYAPEADGSGQIPVHLNANRSTWRDDVYEKIEPSLRFHSKDNKGPGKESQNFSRYTVIDWNRFAESLGL